MPQQTCTFNNKTTTVLYLMPTSYKSNQPHQPLSQQGDEEGERFPRLLYKISQFCELLTSEGLYKLCKMLSMTHS